MDDATLAGREHENMLEWLRISAGQVPDAVVRSERGVAVFATRLPMPLFNQIVVEGVGADDAAMRDAVGAMREIGAPFYVVLRRGRDDHLSPVLTELGIQIEDGVLPGMALHPIPTGEPPLPSGHEIRRIEDEAGLEEHIQTATDGFEMPEPIVRAFVGEALWTRPGCTVYVGYTDGEAVSTGFSVRTGRTLGVFSIATLPTARRRGYGAAMTARLAADGVAAGCDVATLQASEMGRPIYERLGYRTVVEYDVWYGPRVRRRE